ncbi:MAG TPA: rhodanese-like domain-containing protein [Vicinamibacterales bacterium]|nr:rhodanese-like domain-containing protein [Vicinamibacterales bacterium]
MAILLLAAGASTGVQPIVSMTWLQAHLNDASVRVIYVGDRDDYDRGHIPGARAIDHMDTVGGGHRLLPFADLARVLARAGAEDGAQVVLYGSDPMSTGWIYMAFAAVGHGGDVSWLDGGPRLWRDEKRPVSTATPPSGTGQLTVKPAPDVIVDAAWVKDRLQSPSVRLLDVRTMDEWSGGHLPGATLVLWQDLYADQKTLTFRAPAEIRALLAKAGVGPNQEVVTYCAVGMRASLMYWAARSVGIPARVYVGSYQDWRRDSLNPVVR